jgi:cation transporter-like permease
MGLTDIKIGNNELKKNVVKALLVGVAGIAGYVVANVAGFTDNPQTAIILTAICYGVIDAIKHYN